MRICMVVYSLEEFGGLEEIVVSLAIGLQQLGHQVSVLSTSWAPPENQYLRTIRENDVKFVQLPKWLSLPASHWPTKQRLLALALWLLRPLIFLLGAGRFLLTRRRWQESYDSAYNWLREQLTSHLIGPDWRRPLFRLLLNWWRLRWRPDLLHIHGYTASLLFVVEWAYRKGVAVVYEEHQTPDAQFDWWQTFKQSINKATVVVAVSEKSAEALRTVCGVTRPIAVMNPIVADPLAAGWQKNNGIRADQGSILVTTVARLYVTKGLTYLLEAIAQVQALHPAARFRVYGDGVMRQELLDRARDLGLDGTQIFVGAFTRQELPCIMAATDIFVLPSILEGQPLALVEAMAYGRPIVATTVGGIPEILADGVDGLLCSPRDPACLAEKICAFIEDPALRQSMGRAARTAYENGPFQPAVVCESFSSLYRDVLRAKGRDSRSWQ